MKKNIFLLLLISITIINKMNAQLYVGFNVGVASPLQITATKANPKYTLVTNYQIGIPIVLNIKYQLKKTNIGLSYTNANFNPIYKNSEVDKDGYYWKYHNYNFNAINFIFDQEIFKDKKDKYNISLGTEAGVFFTKKDSELFYKGVSANRSNDGLLIFAISPKINFNYAITEKLFATSEIKAIISVLDEEIKPESIGFNVGISYNLGRKK